MIGGPLPGWGLTLLGPRSPLPGLWAGLVLFFLCPGCGLVFWLVVVVLVLFQTDALFLYF